MGATERGEVVVEEVVTTIDELLETRGRHRRDGGAGIVFGDLDQDGSRTRMFQRVPVEAVDLPDHPLAQFLVLRRRRDRRRLVERAMEVEIGPETDVGVQSAAQCRLIGVITRSLGDTVQTTVIDVDPLPAVIHHAHLLPDETDEDNDPFPLAVCHHLPQTTEIIVDGGTLLLSQGQDLDLDQWFAPVLGLELRMKRVADAEDHRLIKLLEEIHPLMLARAVKPVITAV